MRQSPHNPSSVFLAHTWLRSSLLCLYVVLLSACARPIPTSPREAFREISAPELYDDQQLTGLSEAIRSQLAVLQKTDRTVMHCGPVSTTRGAYATALEDLLVRLDSQDSVESKLQYIKEHFRFFEFYGSKNWGEVLLTGYFEPVLPGSRKQTSHYSHPLLSRPPDLLNIPLGSFSPRFSQENPLKGRTLGTSVVPYYSREEIDGQKKLHGQNLELTWVDPIDAFFLHIQGSGTVQYDDGTEEHIVYADKNGHKYVPIGKYLKDDLAPLPVTMQRIEKKLREMSPEERNSLLYRNPSYVFFSKSPRRAITALGVPASPGRTVAVDPKLAPKGALAFLQFQTPRFSPANPNGVDPLEFVQTSRFVVDQDSGGAITGTGRVDLFWGRGEDAKKHAGVLQHPARILYLMPRERL